MSQSGQVTCDLPHPSMLPQTPDNQGLLCELAIVQRASDLHSSAAFGPFGSILSILNICQDVAGNSLVPRSRRALISPLGVADLQEAPEAFVQSAICCLELAACLAN